MSNKYLSTSKPSTGGGNTQNRPSGGQQQTQPSGGGSTVPSGGGGLDFIPGPGLKDPTKDQTDWSQYDGGHSTTRVPTPEENREDWSHLQ